MTATSRNEARVLDSGLDAQTEQAFMSAIGAVSLLGEEKTRGLLELSDETVGRLLKMGIVLVQSKVPAAGEWHKFVAGLERKASGRKTKTGESPKSSAGVVPKGADKADASAGIDLDAFEAGAKTSREKLVKEGQLLPAGEMWGRLGVTRQALAKARQSGRTFTVDVGPQQYYPAFFLSEDIDRRALESVAALLGDLPGWSKWQFFTSAKASLGGVTPLAALRKGELEKVRKAATAFAER
jgi:hypothetical protein